MALTRLDSAMVKVPAYIDKLTSFNLSATILSAEEFNTNTAKVFGDAFFYGKVTALSGLDITSNVITTTSAISVEDFFANEIVVNNAVIENLNNSSLNIVYNTSTVVQNTSSFWDLGYNAGTQYSLNSASLISARTVVQNTSGDWNTVYTNVQSNSGKWESLNTIFYCASCDNITPKYIYFGPGGHHVDSLDGYDIAFNPAAAWTRWFANLGNRAISGVNEPFPNSPLLVYPNEIKKISWSGTEYTVLSTYYFTNSQNWDTAYSLVQTNSANWDTAYSLVQTNSANWDYQGTDIKALTANWESTYATVCSLSASWEESAEIIPTVINYLSTDNVTLCSINVEGVLSYKNIDISDIFSNTKYLFNDITPLDNTQRYIYYGNGYQGIQELGGSDGAFDPNASWTRWFVNLGNGPISGTNYDSFYEIYVYPNEIKKINYNGTSYSVLESYNLSNSQQWVQNTKTARIFATNIGNGTLTAFDITHNLGTRDIITQIYDNATYENIITSLRNTDTNTVSLSFDFIPTNDALRVVVTG